MSNENKEVKKVSIKRYPRPVKFIPKNINKYSGDYTKIQLRSSWEMKLARYADAHPSIISWNCESHVVPYYSSCEDKMRKYYIDFYLYYKTSSGEKKGLLVEVKPYIQTIPPKKRGRKKLETFLNEQKTWQINQDKWKAAVKYAKSIGCDFVTMTEYDLYPQYANKVKPK